MAIIFSWSYRNVNNPFPLGVAEIMLGLTNGNMHTVYTVYIFYIYSIYSIYTVYM